MPGTGIKIGLPIKGKMCYDNKRKAIRRTMRREREDE